MKDPFKRQQQPTPPGRNGSHAGRLDRERVGKYLRILFDLDFVGRQLGIGGLTVVGDWLPDGLVYDLVREQVFASVEETEETSNVFFEAWNNYREYFGTREEFNPKRFLDWLEAGNLDRNPFPKKPAGLWTLPYQMPMT
jgi:hypothetical protein